MYNNIIMKKTITTGLLITAIASSTLLAGCHHEEKKVAQVETDTLVASANYVAYSPEKIAEYNAEGKDVAVFYASKSCGSCNALDASINESLSAIPSDKIIMKADWAMYEEEAKKHGIAKYHTVRYYDGGTERNVKGLMTASDLLKEFSADGLAQAPVDTLVASNSYMEYSPKKVTELNAEGKDVAVFYYSKSCGSCNSLDKSINENISSIPSDKVIMKADWDMYAEEAETFGITKYHTVRYYDG